MNEAEAKKLVDAMGWATIWPRLDHAERMADTILQIADDPRRGEAVKILEIVARVRRAYKHGWSVPAGEMEQLRLLSDAADKKATGPLVSHGAAMRGPRKGRILSRTAAIDAALVALGRDASAKDVLSYIEKSGMCQVEGERIVWPTGNPSKLSGFANRVADRRN